MPKYVELQHARLVINNPPDKHAFASPSKLEALSLCPYMARNCQERPEKTSEAAERGRKLHQAVYDEEIYAGLTPEDQAAVDHVRQGIFGEFDKPGFVIEFEVMVHIKDDEDGEVLSFGTVDTIIHTEDWTLAIGQDQKFGSWMVNPAIENRQLHGYAVGIFQEHPECERVGLQVEQPKYAGVNDELFTVERSDYDALYEETTSVIKNAIEATPEDARPSTDACRFCWIDNCAAYKKTVQASLISTALVQYQIPDLPMAEKVQLCNEFLNKAALAQDFLDNAVERAKAVIMEAGGSDDYRVVAARTSKTTDWKGACKEAGVSEEIIEKHTVEKTTKAYVTKRTRKADGCS